MTTGHIQKKDVNRKVRKMNEVQIILKENHSKYKKSIGKKIPVFEKESVEQKNKK